MASSTPETRFFEESRQKNAEFRYGIRQVPSSQLPAIFRR